MGDWICGVQPAQNFKSCPIAAHIICVLVAQQLGQIIPVFVAPMVYLLDPPSNSKAAWGHDVTRSFSYMLSPGFPDVWKINKSILW